MKRFVILTLIAISMMSCAVKPSFEAEAIMSLCNDTVADSCIVMLPKDTTSTHYVKGAFGENGIYFLSDLPLSDPRMRIYLDDGLRTRYFSDFEYMGQYETIYVYALAYRNFPKLSRYEFDLIRDCDLYYYNGINSSFDWNATYYLEKDDPAPEESFNKWFSKAIPYILN